jgi:1-acyl-sn-glycerol-3-phosphate acyltransferase
MIEIPSGLLSGLCGALRISSDIQQSFMPPITQAQPALKFLPPAFNPVVFRLARLLLPWWIKFQIKINRIDTVNIDRLVQLFNQFQHQQIRLILAFRHPSPDDGFAMMHLLSQALPQAAQKQRVKLVIPPHAHFIYDRGVPIWAGKFVSWLAPNLGATPIHRGKLDRVGLKSIRHLLLQGKLPLAIAPEGATNGHNEIMGPLEPGVVQMGFWCIEDLQAAGQQQEVWILPIGIQYRYQDQPWPAIDRLLQELELDCGLAVMPGHTSEVRYQRLYRLSEHILNLMEDFYRRCYRQSFPGPVPSQSPTNAAEFTERLQTLLDRALQVAEQYFGIQAKGTVIDRCRKLEQAGWDCIYREDISNPGKLSPLERGLADRVAAEASLRMWHMRLVEGFVAVTGSYVSAVPSQDRFAETSLILWDVIHKIKGDHANNQRPYLGDRRAVLTVGEPLSVSAKWPQYSSSRAQAKQALTELTEQLQNALQATIQ